MPTPLPYRAVPYPTSAAMSLHPPAPVEAMQAIFRCLRLSLINLSIFLFVFLFLLFPQTPDIAMSSRLFLLVPWPSNFICRLLSIATRAPPLRFLLSLCLMSNARHYRARVSQVGVPSFLVLTT